MFLVSERTYHSISQICLEKEEGVLCTITEEHHQKTLRDGWEVTLKVFRLKLPDQTHVTVPFSSRGDAKVSQIYGQIFCIPDRPSR